jgi:hypothetical protein
VGLGVQGVGSQVRGLEFIRRVVQGQRLKV